jgi:UDP-N-acetylglucosamine--N-acetylmuramyl-(pentapeptide) pyrophosphoryl-undecaprenol N-acetylglucosamine transferase
MKGKKNIILAAGGTGGHFFPAIALAEELEKSGHNIHLLTDLRCKKYITKDLPVIAHISSLHINLSGLFNKIKSAYQLIIACMGAFILFLKLRPSILVGFGGYPSFPALLAAKFLRVPIIIHEQNCFLGKSNRLFANQVKFIALSYKETTNIPIEYKSKILYTGDIIRSSIRNLPEKKSFNSEVFNLFIVGGSQGALIFSTLIPDTIECLKKLSPDLQINITQQVSEEQAKSISKRYKSLGIEHNLQSFFYNIVDIYSKTDLVIARSGASTIAELTSIGLPAIYIPLPSAAENHQTFNADALVKNKASWSYAENKITPDILAQKLSELIQDRTKLMDASSNLLLRKSNGAEYLADTVLKIIAQPKT